ncbi:MAG: isopenicillin N synthase family oxygenase [Ilumatobacteraceae bacterium]|nr:isopenicillin N synthase family oxygenase [Ilumatobacteraceae bacterium]MBP7888765.1 isopenicillin N synthase family oxygenase [Ilumatobacteraceae bacterium]MBP8208383.1 isopenicillin N synthase family oxygenase [Ilumatobacteraceae bacterium]MBP9052725.1 isopenicillin N synthase family oxygenase [Ilumatobacteraceae bacterium]
MKAATAIERGPTSLASTDMQRVPLVDLAHWADGSDRSGVATAVDEALSSVGFFLVAGHGIDPALTAATRGLFAEFFALPAADKSAVRMPHLGMAGWAPMGMEANGYSFGHETPPDMKESYRLGAHVLPGRVALRGDNVWPAAPDGFRDTVTRYIAEVDRLHMELLRVCATAAGLDDVEFFARCATRNDNTLNVNWYPPLHHVGKPLPHQYRIGPHTDFGTLTVLHREPGSSALEVQLPDGAWVHAPVVDDTFTINGGDMLAHWSSGRWRSAIHRMLPPTGAAAERSLLSLVYFCEPDPETMITPLGGGTAVNAGDYLRSKIEAITMSVAPPGTTPD